MTTKELSLRHQLTFLSFSEPSVSKTPLACMCLYRTLCRADMSHFMTYSTCRTTTRGNLSRATTFSDLFWAEIFQCWICFGRSCAHWPSLAAAPRLLSWVAAARKVGAPCVNVEWSGWSLLHLGQPWNVREERWLESLHNYFQQSRPHCKRTFSPVMANGALNHCSKVLQLLKIVGKRKLSRAQSSGSLFCSGVPVSSTRRGAK